MIERISQPGFYPDMSAADYFADPVVAPSLTQSVAKILIERSPLHAWHAHPRLNPDYRHDDDTKFDIGNIAHKLLLGRGKDIEPIDAPDWRTNAAKAAREEAAKHGRLAVLGKHFARAERLVAAAREQLDMRHMGHLFGAKGDSEIVAIWRDEGFWLRQMIDWLSADRKIFCDYKSTEMSVAKQGLGRMMVNAGWPVQAAMADRALQALAPGGKHQFLFVVQETEAPYALNIVQMSPDAMVMGHKQLAKAIDTWTDCMRAGRWPGYPAEIVVPEYPGWHEQQWLDREIKDAARERIPADILMAG